VAAGLAAAAVALVTLRPSLLRVEGQSMSPTLQPGDVLLAIRGLRPRPGDVAVVLHPDGFEMVKRISAGPGDEAMPGWILGPDQWLITGDNREASDDSRAFGALTSDRIVARVVWPLGIRRRP
jgi:signal peptidase I